MALLAALKVGRADARLLSLTCAANLKVMIIVAARTDGAQ